MDTLEREPERQPRRKRRHHRNHRSAQRQPQSLVWRIVKLVLTSSAILGGLSALIYGAYWYIESNTGPLTSATAAQRITAFDFPAPGAPALTSHQPAGQSAIIALAIVGAPITWTIPATATAPARHDPAILAQVTCGLSANNAPGGAVFTVAMQQDFILDRGASIVILLGAPVPYEHSNYLWEITQSPTVKIVTLTDLSVSVIRLDGLVTRFNPYGDPRESYDLSLELTITGAGDVSCGVFAPPDLLRPIPVVL